MTPIKINPVDERDSAWEDHSPRFRVYLHDGAPGRSGSTATYDIMGADLPQVIDWAQRQAADRLTYAVALVCDDAGKERLAQGTGRGLVWLVGRDGNDNTEGDPEGERVQQRMLLRREAPIVLPAGDAMPPEAPDPRNR